ncbi:hypothetical protein M9H77_26727 [Catharanthus roseus]|uniref:Uncharacterized protein n=1 Tax=Catharanthus roseus TaxID=4058 RepID=A0ACC0ABD6_CATRO|nr:hypothetical protein M9H77_26727 [Catharanthus roseus]
MKQEKDLKTNFLQECSLGHQNLTLETSLAQFNPCNSLVVMPWLLSLLLDVLAFNTRMVMKLKASSSASREVSLVTSSSCPLHPFQSNRSSLHERSKSSW